MCFENRCGSVLYIVGLTYKKPSLCPVLAHIVRVVVLSVFPVVVVRIAVIILVIVMSAFEDDLSL